MGFPDRLLHEDEEIVLDLRPHWWYLAPSTAAAVLLLLSAVAVSTADVHQAVLVGLALLLLVAVVRFALRYARWVTTSFVVTTDRLVFRAGVLAKSGVEIPLDRVHTVLFDQTLFERLLRRGDVVIESAGDRGRQHVTGIGRPSEVQSEIYRQIEDNQRRAGGSARGLSVVEQLERLDDLRRRGVLDEAEFRVEKARLLGRG